MSQKYINSEIEALIEELKDPDEEVRSRAASSLGNIGPEAKAAVPALREGVERRS